jgi:hypothetical protein
MALADLQDDGLANRPGIAVDNAKFMQVAGTLRERNDTYSLALWMRV